MTEGVEINSPERPDPAKYMRSVATLEQAKVYKAFVVAAMDLRPGATAVDIGCGPGTDLSALASGVGPNGRVVGLDLDAAMAASALSVLADADILIADAHRLPLADGAVDAARVDRALQHLAEPAVVLAELHRVMRPGSLAAVAQPDWGTFAVDAEDAAVSQAFTDYTCREVVRNPLMGRQVARLAARAGFVVEDLRPFPTVVRDFETADHVFGLTRNGAAAVAAGYIDMDDAQRWLDTLRAGPTLVSVMLYAAVLRA